jgi:hypothetical protein
MAEGRIQQFAIAHRNNITCTRWMVNLQKH